MNSRMDVKLRIKNLNKLEEFKQLEDVVLSNSQNEILSRRIHLRVDVVVLIITFRKQNRVVVLILFFFPSTCYRKTT